MLCFVGLFGAEGSEWLGKPAISEVDTRRVVFEAVAHQITVRQLREYYGRSQLERMDDYASSVDGGHLVLMHVQG